MPGHEPAKNPRHFWGLKYKIIMLFTIVTVFPLGFVGIFTYNYSISTAQKFLTNYIEQTTEALNIRVNVLFDEAVSILNISKDNSTQAFINSAGENEIYEASKNMGNVFRSLREIQNISQDIFDISVISSDGKCVSERYGYFKLDQDFYSYPSIQEIISDSRKIHFFDKPDVFLKNDSGISVMSIEFAVYRIGSNEVNGIIKVDIDKQSIQSILTSTRWSTNSLAIITNSFGESIFENYFGGFDQQSINKINLENKLASNTVLNINDEEYLVAYNTLSEVPWKLIVGIPKSDILSPFSQTRYVIIAIVAFALIIIIFANTIISNNLVKPIIGLKKLMKSASEGQFELSVRYKGHDEISDLYISFDKMVQKINQLLQSLLEEQANLKSMELKSLQAQINPHFLYNTLDSVVRVAESGKNHEIIELVIALSHFYKAVLSSGQYIIPLKTELEHVENYLKIMKMRYHDILDYEIVVDDRALSCLFPKIVIQPIVENSIYHGIKNVRQGGKIEVSIRLTSEGFVEVVVKDNGMGMTRERLDKLISSLNDDSISKTPSYGLKNVNDRIKLFFGKQYGINIFSQHGKGTTVEVLVPFRNE